MLVVAVMNATHRKRNENPWLNLGFNILLPAIVMAKADDWLGIDPLVALVAALLFPLGYGFIDFAKSKRCNIFSVVGFLSILLTGVIGLLRLPQQYIAIKEAFIPSLLGSIVFISAFTRYPLIRALLFNDRIMNMELINERLTGEGDGEVFQKLLRTSTLKFSLSFLLSALLNYALARYFIHSETGTAAFNKELARMTFWSYPVIMLPCTLVLMVTLIGLMKRLEELTHLSWEEMLLTMKPVKPSKEDGETKSKT
jgi:intracellular septation protein A